LLTTACENPASEKPGQEDDSSVSVSGVTLSPEELTVGASETLTPVITPPEAANKAVTWTSSDTGVAAVDADGTVTGVTAGTATVTTADGGHTDTCAVTVSITIIGDVADVQTYLSAASGGGTASEPVPLPVNLSLASDWSSLLSAIDTGGKYVALDLSACTMTGMTGTPGEFDPGTGITGVDTIVSLVLPNTATSIKAGSLANPTFEHFTALERVSGENIATVGTWAFANCFLLKTVSLPAAVTIGRGVFYDCRALETVDLPLAVTIGVGAFQGCIALETVNLPAAASIGECVFQSTGDQDLTLTLGSTPPTLGIDIFLNFSSPKSVTVKVPSGASGYGTVPFDNGDTSTDNWGNAFRGKGWDGANYLYGTVNANVSLEIEEYTP
jgi:hypothetical protein